MTFSSTLTTGIALLVSTLFGFNLDNVAHFSDNAAHEKERPLCNCELELGDDLQIELGDIVTLETQISCPFDQVESVIWSPENSLECLDLECFEVSAQPLEDICYSALVTFLDGCTRTDEVCIQIKSCDSGFSENEINAVTPEQISDQAEIELEIARTQFVHIEIVSGDDIEYMLWEGFLKAGLRTVTLDFSSVPSGSHQLRARLYPENKFIDIQKL